MVTHSRNTDGAWDWIDRNYSNYDFHGEDTDDMLNEIAGRESDNMKKFVDHQRLNNVARVDKSRALDRAIDAYDESKDTQTLLEDAEDIEDVFQKKQIEKIRDKAPDVYAPNFGDAKSKSGLSQQIARARKEFGGELPDELASLAKNREEQIEDERKESMTDILAQGRQRIDASTSPEETDSILDDLLDTDVFNTREKVKNRGNVIQALKDRAATQKEKLAGLLPMEKIDIG